ncbi:MULTISPECIES: hypothetical protein [Streptomyces]|uniref:hypothetical protein n=1 Tax=Streptomyces TaxID=1883 RepID=UPI001E31654F|nr:MULTISPECIES: hypothetical protein [Streptomyces]UFQ15421.1 hypothetical protein J2N69_10680 [Streptomyces huasconensis]WCL85025.1 hypothetical protein PPN52_10690 [Streptomyces sp. JCM 35825]
MNWWVKARRLLPVLLPGMAAFTLIVAVAHDRAIELPGMLSGGGNRVFLMQMIPLVITSTLGHCLEQRLVEAEVVGARNLRRLDTLLVTACVLAAVAVSLVIGALSGSDEATMAGRNTAFLTGLMLLAGAVHPKASAVAPVGWVFAIIFLGYADFDRPWPWAVTLHAPSSLPALALCSTVFVGGLVSQARVRRTL